MGQLSRFPHNNAAYSGKRVSTGVNCLAYNDVFFGYCNLIYDIRDGLLEKWWGGWGDWGGWGGGEF